ncbi:MAG: dipeptidase [Parvularcula sp.]|jgi:microsomal dipeptidase-like Zn-dependent dipeptidase|nr:dipeptidase [Parvularcula sp.]
MGKIVLRIFIAVLAALAAGAAFVFLALPSLFDARVNAVIAHEPYEVSEAARALHAEIPVADLHADTMLWNRDILSRNDRGHVDLPRLREGGVFLQVFTVVTQTPSGQNYEENDASTDDIRTLAMVSRWPRKTWDSRAERAIYQAEKLHRFAEVEENFTVVRTSEAFSALARDRDVETVAAILGTEGSHALDGDLANIDRLFEAGFRVMGLHHFFDNRLGGSLHGTSGEGLSEFGREAVRRMDELSIIIDVAHSSEATVRDTLAVTERPLIVSHTGFDGHCPSARNISDETMGLLTQAGGLIGVGFWEDVTCNASPAGIADAIIYGAKKFGVEHIALGSDFDGTVTTALDASELPAITQALMDRGMAEADIRRVMGENTLQFLVDNLPED